MTMKKYARILCISDLHFPYCHKDTTKFIAALMKKYKPDKVVLLGDELDHHSLSFHASDPDLDAAGPELQKALGYMETLYKIVGSSATILESNHGSMVYRKAKFHGVPRHLLKSYKEALNAPSGWEWVPELKLRMSNGQDVKFVHGFRKNVLAESERAGCSFVQGHHHSQADIRYHSSEYGIYHFGMTVGCSIDDQSLAYNYNKLFSARPILSHAFIENGTPKLLPMTLNKNGRWNGKTP